MCSCHSFLECCVTFSGVKLSIRSFVLLFTYYVTNYNEFTHFEPHTPQYKKLKDDMITSLTLRITDQNNKIIANGPGTTVVLHIR